MGADTLSPKAVADSQAALKAIDAHLKANPKDAAAWYRRGMVGWALAQRARAKSPPRGLDATMMGRLADTSLRIAAQLEPSNAVYPLTVGKFLLASGVAITRQASYNFFETALDRARAGPDRAAHAEAAVEYGRISWRRYDALKNRRLETQPGALGRSISDALNPISSAAAEALSQASTGSALGGTTPVGMQSAAGDPTTVSTTDARNQLKAVEELIKNTTMALPPDVTGAGEAQKAEKLFEEAYEAAPSHPRAFRSLAMVYADREAWAQLEEFSRKHLAQIPWDPWGWLTLGLAQQRRSESKLAAASFDSAFTYLSPAERGRLDRLERVLRPADTTRMRAGSDGDRLARSRMYWLLADPLWSREGNESRIEFVARVTFAELRWTVEELGLRGADSDRGDIYIRYGPPDIVAAVGPNPAVYLEMAVFWVYRSGLMFAFSGVPTFASMRTAQNDINIRQGTVDAQPVRWDNLASVTVDSMPIRVARFRAAPDSVDLLVSTVPPVETIRASAPQGRSVRGNYWLLAGNGSVAQSDSAVLDADGVRSWSRRVAAGTYLYRVEASAAEGTRAASATGAILATTDTATNFGLRGFGLSDLVVATAAEPRTGAAARWSDFDVTPVIGSLPQQSQLALLWENYEFGERDGAATYEIVFAIKRERSLAGAIAARVVGGLAGAARVQRSGDDRMEVRLPRSVPHAAAFADNLTIDLSDTPSGTYTVSLEIIDSVTRRSATRSRTIVIR